MEKMVAGNLFWPYTTLAYSFLHFNPSKMMKLLGFDIGTSLPKKEDKLFEIFQDGQGKFSAQHKNGDWVWIGVDNYVELMSYRHRQRFLKLESCNKACEDFIKQREHKHIGTISFIATGNKQQL
ncbi:MAG: hypothetical protein ACK50N_02735 [Flavobacteriales bacterium]